MIAHIDITGVRYTLDDNTKKYVNRKIGRLDRFLPRHARKSVTAEVVLQEVNRKNGNNYECSVVLNLPGKRLSAKDSTVNMLAAVDIVEEKLKQQLKKYNDNRSRHTRKHNLVGRMKRRLNLSTDISQE